MRGRAISDLSEEEKRTLILRSAEAYTGECFEGIPYASARLKDTVNKLYKAAHPIVDSLCSELGDCKYEPIFFELEIDRGNPENPEAAVFKTEDGREVYIAGKIDRVDTYKKDENLYVRVIDYKSGSKVFSPSDIETGENLQMFLYLKSVVETKSPEFRKRIGVDEGGRMIPAGVIYVKTSMGDTSVSKDDPDLIRAEIDKKNRTRLGMLLDDSESISAMNKAFIPVKFKASGEPDAYSKAKLYTENGWDKINETIENTVTSICNRMISGDIEASPLNKSASSSSSCKWCDFKPICRNAARFKKS